MNTSNKETNSVNEVPAQEKLDFSHVQVGFKFGKLTVMEISKGPRGGVVVTCQCECGKTLIKRGSVLSQGIKSCGCGGVPRLMKARTGFRKPKAVELSPDGEADTGGTVIDVNSEVVVQPEQ